MLKKLVIQLGIKRTKHLADSVIIILAIQRVKCQSDGETGRRQQDRHKISKTIEQ